MKNNLIKKLAKHVLSEKKKKEKFVPGQTYIPVSGKVYDEKELETGIEAVLDGWWTEGRFAKEFERKLADYLKMPYVSLVNSGSSANLLAILSLTSPVFKDRSVKNGDEIITTAVAFPTTVNPIIQSGCLPVFVDVDLYTQNVNPEDFKKAVSPKTKAVILTHTLGNPFNLKEILSIARKYRLWLIEDCCDALGSRYSGKLVGTFGDIATFSFYPAHILTMGEGGAVVTANSTLHRMTRQFRDWGRDCWCGTGEDNTCRKRFSLQMGKLPFGYDHKYIYSQIGYNLKLTDLQAAIGVAQFAKLAKFIKKRRQNFTRLYTYLKKYEKYFILPKWDKEADPCWFGLMIIVKDSAPFNRLKLVNFLESKKIATRSLFAGNIIRHPAYQNVKYRTVGPLKNSDIILNNGFWIGVYPGITNDMIDYVLKAFDDFISRLRIPRLSKGGDE